ncbi:MAG: PAS domain S-box protein [Smithella sp.]
MQEELHILILEDVPADAELIEEELRENGLEFVSQRVATKAAFIKGLTEFSPDLILADYSLPGFDGQSALKIVQSKALDIPFIFVSGALGEELAIELMKQGATDYVLKNRLSRLPISVKRALQEINERSERRKAEDALKESEERYRTIFDNTGTAMIIIDEEGTIILANKEFEKLTGHNKADLENKINWTNFIFEEDLEKIDKFKKKFKKDSIGNIDARFVARDENFRDVIITSAQISNSGRNVISFLDITERKQVEDELKKREYELELKSSSLEEANTALKVLLQHRAEDRKAMEDKVISNVKKLILPYLDKLKTLKLNENQLVHVQIIEDHLKDIISPFLRNLTTEHFDLTPREIQIATLVRDGKTTKEMTDLLNISATAVDFHRKNIRLKLGIKKKKANLRSFLISMPS